MRLCENSHVAARGPLYFWSYAFCAAASAIESSHPKAKCKPAASEASKYYELLDTFLAVLNGSRQVVLAVSSALTRLFNMIVDSNSILCSYLLGFMLPVFASFGDRHRFSW